jgi:heavy metal efflux system protein
MNALAQLVAFSVRRRGVVLVLSGIVAVAASVAVRGLAIDAVPDVTNVQVTVITSSPGLSPAEVESYLTLPVEMAMNGLPELTEIRSISRTAVSAVTIVFKDGMQIWLARQLVSERLKMAEADIPADYGRPELAPVSTGLGEIYEFYLESDRHTPMELRTTLDWVVAPKLRSVPGVIEVNAMGGEAKQFQVVIDAKRLAEYHLSLGGILETLRHNNGNVGGGYIEKRDEHVVLRGEAQFKSLSDIAETMVSVDSDGTPVLLKNVATVKLGPALRYGVVTKHGKGEIVAGTAMMLIGQNSREVVKNVKVRLAQIQKDLPEGVRIVNYYDRAEFIDRTLHTVAVNLSEGALLVVLVLFFALGTLRGSVLAALAIPLAMGIAVIGMVTSGVTGTLMSLGAIDFGLLVDGAIVMLEGAMTALEHRRPTRRQVPAVVAEAMGQAAKPVTFAVAIILLVYLPLMALEGTEGRMFRPMAVTVAMALGGALLFTLTAFPAACAYLLRTPKPHTKQTLFDRLAAAYRRWLERAMARPAPYLLTILVVVLGTAPIAGGLGAEFVPRIDEGEFSFDIKRLPSISLREAVALGEQAEKVLARFPETLSIVTRTGRAEVATDPVGFDEVEVCVKLRDRDQWTSAHDIDSLGELMKQAIEREVPATFVSVSQPIEDRVNQLLSGSKADLAVKVFGDDLPTLKGLADRIANAIRTVPGTGDLRVQRVLGLSLLDVRVDRARIARYGIPASDVLATVQAARAGVPAGRVFEGARRFDVTVLMPPPTADPESVGDLLVGGATGKMVPLSQVADIRTREGPATILREGLERRVLVESNVRGRDLVSYVEECQQRVAAEVTLPPGYHLAWAGQFANFNRAKARLLLVVPMALAIIFGMLFLMFGELRPVVAVFACVPLALVGGIVGLRLRGMPFSLPAAIGFIALCGVAVLNGVVMASEVDRRRALGEARPFLDGAVAVIRPVLTTALVAAIGFFPMAISNHAGAEVQRPLATVVIGGILSSTALGLIALPLLLRALRRRGAAVLEDEAAPTVSDDPELVP